MNSTPEEKRRLIADALGFKDADFLKWHDGMYEAQAWLIARQKASTSEMCWDRYYSAITEMTRNVYGGILHATVEQKQEALLKAIGVNP